VCIIYRYLQLKHTSHHQPTPTIDTSPSDNMPRQSKQTTSSCIMVLFISCIALYTNIIAVSCNNDAGVISRDVDNNNRLLLRHRSLRMSDYNDPKTTEIRTKESSSLSPITSTSVQSKDINSIPTKLQRPKTKLSLALPQAEDKHCMFVISKLYGNHSQTRVDMTLNWYRSITVESINAAGV